MLDFFRPVPKKRTVKIRHSKGVIFRNLNLPKRILFHFGNGLLMLSVFYGIYLYLPLAIAVFGFWEIETKASTNFIAVPTVTQIGVIPTPTTMQIGTTEYSISIPKIGAFANIVKNVSPFDNNEYSKILKNKVVAQAKGSSDADSGLGRSTFIFAHSTEQSLSLVRQNSIFYLLGELDNGDDIFVGNSGKILKYKVYLKKIVRADEIDFLTYSDPAKEVLILQTCWPIGTNWKRLLVFASKV